MYLAVIDLLDRKIFRHINVVCSRRCSHVWMGRDKKGGQCGLDKGTKNGAVCS
jgi:hypothetical protein